jgi:hypothetical protein
MKDNSALTVLMIIARPWQCGQFCIVYDCTGIAGRLSQRTVHFTSVTHPKSQIELSSEAKRLAINVLWPEYPTDLKVFRTELLFLISFLVRCLHINKKNRGP